MPIVKMQVWAYKCTRCDHEWVPRGVGALDPKKPPRDLPKVCPSCKSPYWNTPRRK